MRVEDIEVKKGGSVTIDSIFSHNPEKRATITLYSLLVAHPKAAQDYFNYLFKKANQEAPGK